MCGVHLFREKAKRLPTAVWSPPLLKHRSHVDVRGIDWKDVEIDKTNEGYDVIAAYEVERPFVSNVYLLVKFDKTVSIPQ